VNQLQTPRPQLLQQRWGRLSVLALLYFVQGMPFGFQVGALPIFLYEQGADLQFIGFSTALAIPWALKFCWAPFVEAWGGHAGSRKRWIVPLQILMAAVLLGAAVLKLPEHLSILMGLLLVLNALAATQDIAVDGMAIDLLSNKELGLGNAAQVVGFKAGMTVAGGVLVWLTSRIDWSGTFLCMALAIASVAVGLLCVEEPEGAVTAAPEPRTRIRGVVATVKAEMMKPGMALIFAVIGSYKMGESIIDVMFKPFLLESGITAADLGLWLGTWGMGASIGGSLLGGVLAMRFRLLPLLLVAGTIRLLPQTLQWLMAVGVIDVVPTSVVVVSLMEHFAGGALTTVMFACMMGWVNRAAGATHFTLLACVEVWGKSVAAFGSGVLASHLGYSGAFGLGFILGLLFLVLVVAIPASSEPTRVKM